MNEQRLTGGLEPRFRKMAPPRTLAVFRLKVVAVRRGLEPWVILIPPPAELAWLLFIWQSEISGDDSAAM